MSYWLGSSLYSLLFLSIAVLLAIPVAAALYAIFAGLRRGDRDRCLAARAQSDIKICGLGIMLFSLPVAMTGVAGPLADRAAVRAS